MFGINKLKNRIADLEKRVEKTEDNEFNFKLLKQVYSLQVKHKYAIGDRVWIYKTAWCFENIIQGDYKRGFVSRYYITVNSRGELCYKYEIQLEDSSCEEQYEGGIYKTKPKDCCK